MIDVWLEHWPRWRDSGSVAVLSTSEQERAIRMRSSTARAHYVAAHTWMHERLADLLDVSPADVPVRVDECGAPSLDGDARQLSFGHHRDLLALAVSSGDAVGIDVLSVPDDAGFVVDTALVLSPAEIALVRSALPTRRGAVFAHCWTRKEAYAKLRRTGLTADLASITLTPCASDRAAASLWSHELTGAVVAIAATGARLPDVRLHVQASLESSARSEGFEPQPSDP